MNTIDSRSGKGGRSASDRGLVIGRQCVAFVSRGGLFVPGLFFLVIGIATVVAPQLLVSLIASFFLFAGFLLCLLAWKVMSWRQRFEKFARGVEGKIILHTSADREGFEALKKGAERESDTGKKIVIH